MSEQATSDPNNPYSHLSKEHQQSIAEDLPRLKPEHQWKGEGPAPARWVAADGTIVYRSKHDFYGN